MSDEAELILWSMHCWRLDRQHCSVLFVKRQGAVSFAVRQGAVDFVGNWGAVGIKNQGIG
jgi:hypothetical protein